MTPAEFHEEFKRLGHAIQTGVAMEMNLGISSGTDAKHLRTGVNVAMNEHAGLVRLLLRKGLITEQEYFSATLEALTQEVARYQASLEAHLMRPVELK